ncbi:major facilitator superfamily domain-containing protein [Mycena sp. CBHHK59/15]|nr:major facilitator superfamily domain-containing protein [Mycena sp. CBHHK59/15]KAJ6608647.1 major facilitator superfamily domain-containing protein [Mycena sp. CBHHK59/15]
MAISMSDVNEETALLAAAKPKSPTPLPKLQLSVIMLIQICEPLASQSIYPYINQLVSELDITGGDERKESLFFLTEAMTVLQWSRASDHVGRKPILLIGLCGTALSMICFGLSRTFLALVVSRCLTGLLNGNIGVMKSAMGDLTDRTNRAEGFAYLPVVWAAGASLGPLIGGALSRPHDRFPTLFPGAFWHDFPYFLPCAVTGGFVFFSCFVVLVLFKEGASRARTGPLPLRELLTFPVLISVSNYVALAFLNTTLGALLPLFLAMPLPLGGLGLPPATIGLVLASYGAATGLFQVFFFARLIRKLGERRVFINGLATCLPAFALFPLTSVVAQRYGVAGPVWGLVGCVLALGALMDTSFGAIFMYVTASAPRSSRGTANGLSQTTVALARAVGPALSTSLFSLSVQRGLLGGYAVYLVFFVLSGMALLLARQLPEQVWEEVDD